MRERKKVELLTYLLMLSTSLNVYANVEAPVVIEDQVNAQSSAITSVTDIDKSSLKKKPWSLANSLALSTSVKETDAPSDYLTSSFSTAFTYKVNELYSAQAVLAASKQLQDDYNDSIDAAFVGLSFNVFSYRDTIKGTAKVRTYLPVNNDAVDTTSFRGRLYTNFSLSANLSDLGLNYLTISSGLTLAKNFHEFQFTNTNSFNTSHYSTLSLAASFDFADKYYLSIGGSVTTKWDYDNDLTGPSSYALSQEIGYSFAKGWSAALSHEIGGSAYGYTGNDLEIDIFDKDNSSLSTNVQFVY